MALVAAFLVYGVCWCLGCWAMAWLWRAEV